LKIAHHKFAIHGVVAIHGGKRSSILTRRWRLVNINDHNFDKPTSNHVR
jgi:hypothetical protein